MEDTQQPVDHNLGEMEWQEEEEQLKFSQESSEGASDESTEQVAGAAWAGQLKDQDLVSVRKLLKDIARSAAEGATDIRWHGHNRHNMDLLKSLFDTCYKISKDIERLYKDIAAVIAQEEGTDTGSAQGNYNPAAPISCQKFGPITILLLHKLLVAAKSVGIIFVERESDHRLIVIPFGTCFRLGTKYVMTCKHVVDQMHEYISENPGDVRVEFNFCKDFSSTFEQRRFLITKRVPCFSDTNDLDYCVLEFSIRDSQTAEVQTELPALGHLVCDVEHSDTISLVGHPGGDHKAMDPNCPYPHPEVGVYLKLNPQPKGDFSQLNDPGRVTYSSVMGPGSSGAPGFDKGGNLVVMHARGYRPHDQNMEQGVKMTAIRDDLRNNHPDLCEELFPTTQSTSTETTT
ncbi:serine protease FAM111A-like [Branchiostoma lanceolatum]|uniref:serine protease FAM111A-like n=1 Tax=Branchiostoma lanceolatum TaxID=7740 RepID=UPI0034536C14